MSAPGSEQDAVVIATGLTKHYGPRVGVHDLALRVPAGCVFGFLGPNGAGKTTAIRLLLGFLQADRGEARVFGRDCWRESHEIKRDVGYLPGDLRLYPWMSGRDALAISGRARGRDLAPRARELAALFELDLTIKARRMSRGMRQKLGLLLALAHEPRLLVLDEPTSALDPLAQDRLYEHLRGLARAGHTVFFSSHVLSEVAALCDRVGIIRGGRLIADEPLADLRRSAPRAVVVLWEAGRQPPAAAAPPCLVLRDARDGVWRGALEGPVSALLAWLHGRPVADLSIQPPDLDSLFRRYYREGDAP